MMGDVLVLAERSGSDVKKVTLELLALAKRVGDPAVVWIGPGFTDEARNLLGEHGAVKVYVADDEKFINHPVAPAAEVLAHLMQSTSPAAVIVASTADGKEVAGRLAIKTESGVITDAVDIAADATATQSIFGGSVIVQSKVSHGTPIITVRPNSAAPETAPAAAERVDVDIELSPSAMLATVVGRTEAKKDARPDLAEAAIVVSGGRGVGGPEGFGVIEALADALGAAVGASRAATDAGWYPHQFQVGQTGKTVAPQLYIANGISGAIQHRAGMQTSKTIVVVNKDPEAPIFELADYGVVGDLHSIVPQLTEEIGKRAG
jgi:electron transfer flavoprotein alpha subunit